MMSRSSTSLLACLAGLGLAGCVADPGYTVAGPAYAPAPVYALAPVYRPAPVYVRPAPVVYSPGPRRVWVPAHRGHGGRWIPGHWRG